MKTKLHIYDIDGVLVDSSHRYRNKPDGTIDLEYWLANCTRENIRRDKLLPMAAQYKADCADPTIYAILCTSRAYHQYDIDFIADYLGLPDKLIMRPVGNFEPDAVLKRRVLVPLFNLRQFRNCVRRFWDDNIKNLDSLRPYGVECIHVPSNQGH